MFIGRERELAALDKLYESDKFEFVVIYGRRRVGKTALISQFIDDKNAIYFMGVESNAKQNLENFSKSILSFHTGMDAETSFLTFQAALEYVFKLSEKERIILAIDEYPYVARSSKSLASTIQLLIDQYKDTSKLMLILCGSSMSYMEDHVLAYKAPLYGRRTAQMKILPFDFEETCRYFKNFTDEEKAYVYGIVGGTPQYLLQMSDKTIKRGDIYYADLNPVVGSEQGGTRPVLVISNDIGNRHSPTVIIAAITSRVRKKKKLPTHLYLGQIEGLPANSIILFEQLRTIDKSRLKEHLTHLDEQYLKSLEFPLLISIGVEKRRSL